VLHRTIGRVDYFHPEMKKRLTLAVALFDFLTI
jgi:hypothetical protein